MTRNMTRTIITIWKMARMICATACSKKSGDGLGVVGDAAHQFAERLAVKEAEGERLHVVEEVGLQALQPAWSPGWTKTRSATKLSTRKMTPRQQAEDRPAGRSRACVPSVAAQDIDGLPGEERHGRSAAVTR